MFFIDSFLLLTTKKLSITVCLVCGGPKYLLLFVLEMYFQTVCLFLSLLYLRCYWSAVLSIIHVRCSNLDRIYYFQKRASSYYRAHSVPLFSRLDVLDIFQVNSLHVAKFLFCYHNQLFPPKFPYLFVIRSQGHLIVLTSEQQVVIDYMPVVDSLQSFI